MSGERDYIEEAITDVKDLVLTYTRKLEAENATLNARLRELERERDDARTETERVNLHLEQIKGLAQTGVRRGIDQQIDIALEARKALKLDDFAPDYLQAHPAARGDAETEAT